MTLKNIFTLTKKELKSYFDSPTAYIILAVFLILWEFLFFRSFFLIDAATLRPLFDLLPWLFLFLIPAITMRSFSQEKEEGTLEFTLTHPVLEIEFLLAKFLSVIAFVLIALSLTLPIPLSLSVFGKFDFGTVFSQYLASVLLAGFFASLGIFISSLFKNSVTSLLASCALSFIFIIIGTEVFSASLPLFLTPVLEHLSAVSHFDSMSKGAIDFRDFLYFLSATAFFLSLGFFQLISWKLNKKETSYKNLKIGVFLLGAIFILISFIGAKIPGRLDLTANKIHTLSSPTKKILQNLPDIVNINLYCSKQLPAQLQPTLREIKDLLYDYKIFGKGNLIVNFRYPEQNTQIANEAVSLGITPVQFNVIGQEEFKVKTGYLGLSVSFGDQNEVIPFIDRTDNLEYQLTSFIKKLTITDKKKVGFLAGHGEKSIYQDLSILKEELDKQFTVEEITFTEENKTLPEDLVTLVIAGPSEEIPEEQKGEIKNFIANGGSILFLIDKINVNLQTLSVTKNENSFADPLREYGITISDDLLYDLRSNENVTFGGGYISYTLPYPFWIRAQAADQSSLITSGLEGFVLPWGSSIKIDQEKLKGEYQVLFETTQFASSQEDSFNIMPDQEFDEENLEVKTVAISAILNLTENQDKKSRLAVVGDSDFLTDQFAQQSAENIAFGLAALDWLTQEESLASIRIKSASPAKLVFTSSNQPQIVKYGNFAFVILATFGFGFYRLMKRKTITKKKYTV